MKQLLQFSNSSRPHSLEVPAPSVKPGHILISTVCSLISVGTERMTVEFLGKSLLQKALTRPDLVTKVLEKARREGLLSAFESVRNRLSEPVILGYSSAGKVVAVGEEVSQFQVGDRVACGGAGYAVHAEIVCVPRNLAVKLSGDVDFESAAFTTVGAIAMQGLRLSKLQLGETVTVIGLGLIGLMIVQLAKASGFQVLGMDPDGNRCSLARKLGCEMVATSADELKSLSISSTSGLGCDAVIITAATSSDEPVEVAGEISRDRGIVVAVGAVGMKIPRGVFYGKELTFRVSRSYGPGRYDSNYEEKGIDYPIGYVRWTENRNMEAFAELLAEGKVNVKPLITHRFPIEKAPEAYELVTGKTDEPFLGILITYPEECDLSRRLDLRGPSLSRVRQTGKSENRRGSVSVGVLGAGNFMATTLLPLMRKAGATELTGVCTSTGVSARRAADKFGFQYCTTDEAEIFKNPDIKGIVIATRHHLHARQIMGALTAGKHVFCEKPLCLNHGELAEIVKTYNGLSQNSGTDEVHRANAPLLMVGFNRRFAPMAVSLKEFIAGMHEPLIVNYRVNAGYLPPEHWLHDPQQGGGRILGEVCHFVDFLTFLVGQPPFRVSVTALPGIGRYQNDNVIANLEFSNGSIGTITYVTNGDRSFSKERVEVFGGGLVAILDDFRKLSLVRDGRKRVQRSFLRQDKGHRAEWERFIDNLLDGGSCPIPFEEIVSTTLTTFAIVESMNSGAPIEVNLRGLDRQVQRLEKKDSTDEP